MQTVGKPPAPVARVRSAARRNGRAASRDRSPRELKKAKPWLTWLPWLAQPRLRHRIRSLPIVLFVMAVIVVTLAIGAWGYEELELSPELKPGQALYHAFKLYFFDIGPAGGGGSKNAGPNWQIVTASILAALLVTRAPLAIAGSPIRRLMIRRFMSS